MATIVRRNGAPTQTATLLKLSDATEWAQTIAWTVVAGQHFPPSVPLISRYSQDILATQAQFYTT